MVSHIKSRTASIRNVDEILRIFGVNWLPCLFLFVIKVDITLGLSDLEATRRLADVGPNEFTSDPPDPIWLKYLKQFMEPMIGLLIASAFVSIIMGQFDDAISISAVSHFVVIIASTRLY